LYNLRLTRKPTDPWINLPASVQGYLLDIPEICLIRHIFFNFGIFFRYPKPEKSEIGYSKSMKISQKNVDYLSIIWDILF
jgi:hypothetical protein